MASGMVTLICVVSGALAGAPEAAPELTEALAAHDATLAPSRLASRDDDGSVYLTITVPSGDAAGALRARLADLDGVVAVYAKPATGMP